MKSTTTIACPSLVKVWILCFLFISSSLLFSQSIKYDYGVYPAPTPPTLPAKGGKITDPTFGTQILRITDASDGNDNYHAYSYWPTFNKNSTQLYIFHVANTGATLFDFDPINFSTSNQRNAFLSNPPSGQSISSEDAIWSGLNPDLMIVHTETEIYYYNVKTNTWTLIKDFSNQFNNLVLAQMSRSVDDNVFAFTRKNQNYNEQGYFAWTKSTNSLYSQNSTSIDEVQVDKTGQYMTVKDNGVSIVNLQTQTATALTYSAPDYGPHHSDNGSGFVIGFDNYQNTYRYRSMANPHTHYSVNDMNNDWTQDGHLSCSSPLIDQTRRDKVKLINFKTNNYEYKETNLRRESKDCSRSRTKWLY